MPRAPVWVISASPAVGGTSSATYLASPCPSGQPLPSWGAQPCSDLLPIFIRTCRNWVTPSTHPNLHGPIFTSLSWAALGVVKMGGQFGEKLVTAKGSGVILAPKRHIWPCFAPSHMAPAATCSCRVPVATLHPRPRPSASTSQLEAAKQHANSGHQLCFMSPVLYSRATHQPMTSPAVFHGCRVKG